MSSREKILERIRAAGRRPPALPEIDTFESRFEDPVGKFAEVLTSIGGELAEVSGFDGLRAFLDQKYGSWSRRVSSIPGLADWTDFDLQTADPHSLAEVNLAVIQGETGVAENAAIWVGEQQVPHRVLPFITQYLVIVLPKAGIVCNMHDALAKIGPVSEGWGAFIAGPSKTADIEQSLVIGAHGARGLTVVLT